MAINLKILVKRCAAEQENHKKLMNIFNHAQLTSGIKDKEENRTQKHMLVH